MGNYLVSVVIPTKNRYSTLFPLVEVLKKLCEEHRELEVVIHDNSDENDKAISFFSKVACSNIKYFYSSEWLSVGDNSDKAILCSSGDFVSFIGDDDAFVPEILDVARWMKEKEIDSCGCEYSLYRWPAALLKGKNSFEYKSMIDIYEEIDCAKEIKRIMKNGIQSKNKLPGVYHGLVRRTVLDNVYKKTGTFFPGPSPDMANAFALSLFVKKHIMINVPFIVDGYSKASTGHLTEAKTHIGRLEDQQFLPKDTVEKWTNVIPKIWLPNTIWPESAIQALKRCGREELVNDFNYNAMYVKISVLYPQCKELCEKYIKKYSSIPIYIATIGRVALEYVMNKVIRLKKSKGIINVKINDPMTIEEAIINTSNIIRNNNMLCALSSVVEEKYS